MDESPPLLGSTSSSRWRCACFLAHLRNMLFWSVLAASTIGPGTVAVCSASGASFQGQLFWCILLATLIAWVMQEGAARLTIVCGLSVGQAIHSLSPSHHRVCFSMRVLLAVLINLSTVAYSCNVIVGTMAAVEMITPSLAAYYLTCVGCGVFCTVLLVFGSTEAVSTGLGLVVVAMTACFLITVVGTGVVPSFGRGLLPSLPAGSTTYALSVVGTTAVPINILMGSALGRGRDVRQADSHAGPCLLPTGPHGL